MTVLNAAAISDLNARAVALLSELDNDARWALSRVASEAGLTEVRRNNDVILYQAKSGELVICWVDGAMKGGIGDGGLGFDTQIDLVEDEDEE